MSSDDIVFDEVSYRQPQRARRPDRDRRYACLAYGTPGPDDLAIFLDRGTADRIERHALSDTSVELGGILLGRECIDEETGKPFVWITEALEARHFQNTQASFTYTHESWEAISRERDQKHPDLDIVGWYHTHPDFGIFLSGHDQFIQRHFFGQPLQVAYVVDPIRQTRGFFQWRNGALIEVEGYDLVAPREERLTLARSVNDLEGIPNLDGGGALSPRLEAELIAMLNRPQTTASSSDRGQSAAVFSLLGMVLGALGVALALWISTLTGQVREQTESLAHLRTELAKQREFQDYGEALASVRAKEEALNALLREVSLGTDPERFVEMYSQLQRERDAAVAEAEVYDQIRRDLIEKNEQIEALRSTLARRTRRIEALETDQERLDQLREQLAALREEAEKVPELQATLDTYRDVKVGSLPRKYERAWYAAVVGWSVVVLLGLGLVAVVARSLPASNDREPRADGPEPKSSPPPGRPADDPHRIE